MSPEPESPAPPLPPERFEELLEARAPRFSVELAPAVVSSLSVFLSELDRWRRTTNLTGALEAVDLADHALESLVGSELIVNGERVIDIGSGAGFPGIPIAIRRPELGMTLLEPRGKRAAFLRHILRTLGLSNTVVREGRIEEVGGQTFGVATTRAVGGFASWIGDSAFLAPGGWMLAWTTEAAEVGKELPGFELVRSLPIPGSARREVAFFRKR